MSSSSSSKGLVRKAEAPAFNAVERTTGRETNWLGSLLGPVEQYSLAFESLVNDLHQVLVFERFCEKGESSTVECGLAH